MDRRPPVPDSPARFYRTLETADLRMLIRSQCVRCGESKLVSTWDSSLQDWEEHHQCTENAGSGGTAA